MMGEFEWMGLLRTYGAKLKNYHIFAANYSIFIAAEYIIKIHCAEM